MTAGLPQETAAWIESEVGGSLVAARRMTGGLTSSVHRCTVILPSGARTIVVLRRCTGVDPALRTRALEDELSALRQLEGTAVPAPVPLAISGGRETDGTAALLMSRVPGHVDLAPEDPTRWVHQAALALTDIQALPFQFPEYRPRPRTSPAEVPVGRSNPPSGAWLSKPCSRQQLTGPRASPMPTSSTSTCCGPASG